METINKMQNTSAQKYYSFIIVFVFALFLFVFFKSQPTSNIDINFVKIGGVDVRVELAIDKTSQERGLSGRESLAVNTGMLFMFNKPDKYYFWMKGMNFPIDIIWINENNKIVYIKREAQPENFLETYGPEENSLYVLEVPSGFSDMHGLKTGDSVLFLK